MRDLPFLRHPKIQTLCQHLARMKWAGWVGLLLMVLGLGWLSITPALTVNQVMTRVSEAAGGTPSPAMTWRLALEPEATPPLISPTAKDPETWVHEIYAQVGQGQRAQALATAAALVGHFPNFQLGQLLYADLLNISAPVPMDWTVQDPEHAPLMRKRLDELLLESQRRLMRNSTQSLHGKIPAALAFVSPQLPHVVAVDASQSRLYWFENRPNSQGQTTLQLVRESYVSVGMHGMGKDQEGDGKTPIGVYFIQRQLPGQDLPDLYGAGALTLNYPNAVDHMRGKTGSGIWLHGTPSAQYARAPESTDGCVVLANPDMAPLLQLPSLRHTPVIIAEKLDWIPAQQAQEVFDDIQPALDAWQAALAARDPEALKRHYSPHYVREGLNLEQSWPHLLKTTSGLGQRAPLELVSALQWKDREQFMVVTLKMPASQRARWPSHMRQYWQKEGAHWRIIFQGLTH